MENRNEEKEFSEEELDNLFAGFQIGLGNKHPFSESKMFTESKKEELMEIKKQLEEIDRQKTNRGRR